MHKCLLEGDALLMFETKNEIFSQRQILRIRANETSKKHLYSYGVKVFFEENFIVVNRSFLKKASKFYLKKLDL